MKILVLAQRHADVSLDQMRPHFKAEVEAVWRLYSQGIVREFYTRGDSGGPAILTVESPSLDEARQALAELPLVEKKLLDLDLIPLAPFNLLTQLFQTAV
jgi:hypothetical protein